MRGKIRKSIVDALQPDPGGKEVVLWDTELKGFGVRVRSSGKGKSYILHYRAGSGRAAPLRKYTIGKHGSPWTPDSARREAERLLGQVKNGGDPAANRVADRQCMTVAELCDLYIAEGCATKKASTIYTDRGRIERHIKPLLGRKKAKDLTAGDIQAFLVDVARGKTACDLKTGARGRAIVVGGKGTASRTVGLLGGIFSFGKQRGICSANPTHGVRRFPDNRNNRFLSQIEIRALGYGLMVMEDTKIISPTMANAIRLLLLTGCRKGEVLSLRWANVDFEEGYLRLPESKTGAKAIALGASALELLGRLPRFSGWVFPAARGKGHAVGLQHAWEDLREWCGLDGVRLHDLRHSFASVGAGAGDSLLIIGELLGHRDPKTTIRYAHVATNPAKAAADRISGEIAAHLERR